MSTEIAEAWISYPAYKLIYGDRVAAVFHLTFGRGRIVVGHRLDNHGIDESW